MIEPTDEMRMVAYRDAREWAAVHGHQQPDDRMINDVLTAVLALVERDYVVRPRTVISLKLCGWRGFAADGDAGCIRRAKHEGGHGFSDGSGEQDPS